MMLYEKNAKYKMTPSQVLIWHAYPYTISHELPDEECFASAIIIDDNCVSQWKRF